MKERAEGLVSDDIVDYIPVIFIYQNISGMDIFWKKKKKSKNFYHADRYSIEISRALLFKKNVVESSFILEEESEWKLEQKWEVEKKFKAKELFVERKYKYL